MSCCNSLWYPGQQGRTGWYHKEGEDTGLCEVYQERCGIFQVWPSGVSFFICFQHKQMFSCLCYSYIITVIQVNLFCVFLNTFFSRLFCRKNKPSNAFMVSKVTSKYGVCQVEKKSLLLEFYEMLEDIIALFFILSDRVKWPHITTHLKMWWSITHYGQLHMYLIFLWGSKRKKGAENGDDWPFPAASPCDASCSDLSTSCNVMSCW